MSESQLFDGQVPVVETQDGFVEAPPADDASLDSEGDFDDEEFDEADQIGEAEAGNAEGGADGHLDDPERLDPDR